MNNRRAVVTEEPAFWALIFAMHCLPTAYSVVAVDNLLTGRLSNLDHLRKDARFEFQHGT